MKVGQRFKMQNQKMWLNAAGRQFEVETLIGVITAVTGGRAYYDKVEILSVQNPSPIYEEDMTGGGFNVNCAEALGIELINGDSIYESAAEWVNTLKGRVPSAAEIIEFGQLQLADRANEDIDPLVSFKDEHGDEIVTPFASPCGRFEYKMLAAVNAYGANTVTQWIGGVHRLLAVDA